MAYAVGQDGYRPESVGDRSYSMVEPDSATVEVLQDRLFFTVIVRYPDESPKEGMEQGRRRALAMASLTLEGLIG